MLARLLPILLVCSFVLLGSRIAPGGAPTIQLVVPAYEYPGNGTTSTFGGAISNNGIVIGIMNVLPRTNSAGYEWLPNGRFGPPIIAPRASETSAFGVNTSGVVSGTFFSNADHGFFYDHGVFTKYDVPGAIHTNVKGVNDAGDFCGFYFSDASVITPFLNVGGTVIPFSLPGIDVVYADAINNLGQVAGEYTDPVDPSVTHGFFRDADGTLTYPIDPANSRFTAILGLNDKGILVGTWVDLVNYQHAFVLRLPGQFLSYDYPDGFYSTFRGVNNSGLISGSTLTESDNAFHAFIVQLVR